MAQFLSGASSRYAGSNRIWAFRQINKKMTVNWGDPSDGSLYGTSVSVDDLFESSTEFYHIGLIYNAGSETFFLNGTEVAWTGGAPTSLWTAPLNVSLGHVGASYFEGKLGEVWFYSRPLTPLEIQHNYLATKWRYR